MGGHLTIAHLHYNTRQSHINLLESLCWTGPRATTPEVGMEQSVYCITDNDKCANDRSYTLFIYVYI